MYSRCWTCRSISVSPNILNFKPVLQQNSGRHCLLSIRQTAACRHTQTVWLIRLIIIRPVRCFWLRSVQHEFHCHFIRTVFQAWTFLICFQFKAHAGTAYVSHCLSKLRHTRSHRTAWHLSESTYGKRVLALIWKPFNCCTYSVGYLLVEHIYYLGLQI